MWGKTSVSIANFPPDVETMRAVASESGYKAGRAGLMRRRQTQWRQDRDMKNAFLRAGIALLAGLHLWVLPASARDVLASPPSQIYGELFHRVQVERLFPDSKTFADAIAKVEPSEVMAHYEASKGQPGFVLRDFVDANFIIPGDVTGGYQTELRTELRAHVDRLWTVLTREPGESRGSDSSLPLSTRYVVPGGRFREMYYWDSYFTMLGLQVSGRHDLVAGMVENFAGLIDRHGHIPNGTRTYYLSRSQPPFFAAMVRLQASHDGDDVLVRRLPQLEREYAFWMDGADGLPPGEARRRVVRLADGAVLNRYWDELDIPRDEAYLEDIETAKQSRRPPAEVYRELRAAAESGWDFSSRWLDDGKTLATIRTTDFLPVDLNSLLYQLELTIARACEIARRADCISRLSTAAQARREAVVRFMWHPRLGAFVDYDRRHARPSDRITAATAYPLFAGLATREQAAGVASAIGKSLLSPHGLATTTVETGQQWDAPNGWAPLQWVAVEGLRRYGEQALALKIATGWVAENARVFCRTGKLVEKYNVREAGEGAGGEYPVQDGFGWTNAVLIKLLELYPKLARGSQLYSPSTCAS
jgi:alpha,alpha-trehalase